MITEDDLKKYGFVKPDGTGDMEMSEEGREAGGTSSVLPTGYPSTRAKYRMIVEGFNISIEEPYFWVLDYLRYMWSFNLIDKITDIFAAAENSAFFGVSQQRLGLQQDRVSQYLATIGKMVKELFQLVRELRILDERLGYYFDSYTNSKSAESAEITLKGIWVDQVEQGAKNPASVYGMAREVQFLTLPDLFFATHPLKQEDVDSVVERDRGQFNRKVREVLKRKLRNYLAWKEHTFDELKNRRIFTLKYLRQHYEIVKMYMAWVKPYLRNIQRLTMDQGFMKTPDILAAFETSMIEVEILARKPKKVELTKKKEVTMNQVILVNFMFRTRPEMSYQQEGYQRGPLHVGRIAMTFRAYAWTDEQVNNYKKLKDLEDFRLIELVDSSVKIAMDSLGDELMRYLAEAGEDIIEKKEMAKATAAVSQGKTTFFSIPLKINVKSMSMFFKGPNGAKSDQMSETDKYKIDVERSSANTSVKAAMWNIYYHFKKHHAMLNW